MNTIVSTKAEIAWRKFEEGDDKGFDIFYRETYGRIIAYYKGKFRDSNQIEENVSKIFLKLYKGVKEKELKIEDNLGGYLYRMIKGKEMDMIRQIKTPKYKRNKYESIDHPHTNDSNVPKSSDYLSYEYDELLETFGYHLSPQQQRLVKYSIEGYDNKEIAEKENKSEKTINNWMTNLKKSMIRIFKSGLSIISFFIGTK